MSQALLDPTLPTETDATLARETSRLLAPRMVSKTPLSFRVGDASKEETLQLPASAVKMLVRILEEMARGNAPIHSKQTQLVESYANNRGKRNGENRLDFQKNQRPLGSKPNTQNRLPIDSQWGVQRVLFRPSGVPSVP